MTPEEIVTAYQALLKRACDRMRIGAGGASIEELDADKVTVSWFECGSEGYNEYEWSMPRALFDITDEEWAAHAVEEKRKAEIARQEALQRARQAEERRLLAELKRKYEHEREPS